MLNLEPEVCLPFYYLIYFCSHLSCDNIFFIMNMK